MASALQILPKVPVPLTVLDTGRTVTGAQPARSLHQLLASYLTIWGEGWRGKSNNKRETPQPRIRSPRGRAVWVDMLCLLPGTTMRPCLAAAIQVSLQ